VLAGWRQSARPTQSVVLVGCGGALVLYTLFAAIRAVKGQRRSLNRALACLALFIVLGAGWRVYKSHAKAPEAPGTETGSEIGAWGPSQYADLMRIYHSAQVPSDSAALKWSWRPPYDIMTDPEYYRLQAVFMATPNVSVRNNLWRLLVWRRMALDWAGGHPVLGAGVGRPWFYEALYHTGFHYGDDREGLDPHNSYLNTLYRYGIVGLGLLLAIFVSVLAGTFNALRDSDDPLLEGLLLYFFYTAIFAFFTVSLEGSPYAFPIWMTIGLLAGITRLARQEQH
jgi:O-antigen ligase